VDSWATSRSARLCNMPFLDNLPKLANVTLLRIGISRNYSVTTPIFWDVCQAGLHGITGGTNFHWNAVDVDACPD